MNVFKFLKDFFTPRISDEEVESQEWVLCPKCNVNISKEDLEHSGWVCPNCSHDFKK